MFPSTVMEGFKNQSGLLIELIKNCEYHDLAEKQSLDLLINLKCKSDYF